MHQLMTGFVGSIEIEETDSKEPLGSIGAGQGSSKSDEQSSDEAGRKLRQRTSHTAAHSSGTKGSDKSLLPKASMEEPSAPNPPHSDKWWCKLENCVVGLVLLEVMLILIFVGYLAFNWYSIKGLILYGALLLVIVFVVAIFFIWKPSQPIQPMEPTPELPPVAATVSEEVVASAKVNVPAEVDVFNIDTEGIRELIKRYANDKKDLSGEIPIGGTIIKWTRKPTRSGIQLKWKCRCEDTQTGLKINGPRKESRDGALEHCLRELFDELKKKQ